jgi:hypothetical protein
LVEFPNAAEWGIMNIVIGDNEKFVCSYPGKTDALTPAFVRQKTVCALTALRRCYWHFVNYLLRVINVAFWSLLQIIYGASTTLTEEEISEGIENKVLSRMFWA